MRKRIEDLAELVVTATEALVQALGDGDEKHPPGSWKEETTGEQINHIMAHMARIQSGEWIDKKNHEHVTHVICRAVILSALRKNPE